MPHNFDFSKLENVKTVELKVDGWISPLYIEYGIYTGVETGDVASYFWRVKGTLHTFVIPILRMDFLSSGNYVQHFTDTLEGFRQDYLSWVEEGFKYTWSKEYKEQYGRFIVV